MTDPVARKILITGITGQVGYYLTHHLVPMGHEVHGLVRRESRGAAEALFADLHVTLHEGDIRDDRSLQQVVGAVAPDRVFHLAAGISVQDSWADPVAAADVNALGVARMLEAVRFHAGDARFYYASSSEAIGRSSSHDEVFDETSPLRPATPYGVTKAFGHHLVRAYRDRYGMFAVSGIAFNHESPIGVRPAVVQHVAGSMIRIAAGQQEPVLEIGNLDAARDWGFTGDYVRAMALMLEAPTPQDYVIATGETRTVGDLVEIAAATAGIAVPELLVAADRLRPHEINRIASDPSRIKHDLGWESAYRLEDLLQLMVSDAGFRERALASLA